MENNIAAPPALWAEDFSDKVQILKGMASQIVSDKTYYYVANFKTGAIDYVNDQVDQVLGLKPDVFKENGLQNMLTNFEENSISKKDNLVKRFYNIFIDKNESKYYKNMYFFRVRNKADKIVNIMHQSTPLSFTESGDVDRLLVMHADATVLGLVKNDKVSFVHTNGGESYLNIEADNLAFKQGYEEYKQTTVETLTNRELEIIKLMSEGLGAEQIADRLIISFNTIRTHRKNMLRKTGCANSTQLVAMCITANLI